MRRFVFAPRWVAGHVTVIAIVVTCLYLGRWQWGVSQHTHSMQNMAYALQWPMFAVFFAVMWWRMLRLECRKLDGEFDDEIADEPAVKSENSTANEVGEQPSPAAGGNVPVPDPEPIDEDAALAAYNRMLAELAARDNAR